MSLFDFAIDKTTHIPFYYQLKNFIMKEIREGCYKKDSAIPTEKEISEFL